MQVAGAARAKAQWKEGIAAFVGACGAAELIVVETAVGSDGLISLALRVWESAGRLTQDL